MLKSFLHLREPLSLRFLATWCECFRVSFQGRDFADKTILNSRTVQPALFTGVIPK